MKDGLERKDTATITGFKIFHIYLWASARVVDYAWVHIYSWVFLLFCNCKSMNDKVFVTSICFMRQSYIFHRFFAREATCLHTLLHARAALFSKAVIRKERPIHNFLPARSSRYAAWVAPLCWSYLHNHGVILVRQRLTTKLMLPHYEGREKASVFLVRCTVV